MHEGVETEISDKILADHVKIGVEVEGNDAAGLHKHILSEVHELIADFVIGAALDGADEHVIGLSPGAVLNLYVIAVRSEVKVVDSGLGVCALTELDVVVAGVGDPHFKHVDGVVEVGDPAFAGEVEVAVLALLEEYVPVALLDGHVDADGGQILRDASSS